MISIRLVRLVRVTWCIAFSLFFMLNLDQFSYSAGWAWAPKYWTVGVFIITFILFPHSVKRLALIARKPISLWLLGYLSISVLWLALFDNYNVAMDGFTDVITTCLFMSTGLLMYSRLHSSSKWWNATLWVALIMSVASVLVDYIAPGIYASYGAGNGIIGRAAGFYLNPNIAGSSIVLILACLIVRISPQQVLVASGIAVIGLLATLSRSSLAAWLILVFAAVIRGRISRWYLPLLILGALLIGLMSSEIYGVVSQWVPDLDRNVEGRLHWLLGMGGAGDYAAREREYAVAHAWALFSEVPLLGHGLGYMIHGGVEVGSHNMILRHLVDYGVIGAFIFPLFLLASLGSAPPSSDRRWLRYVATAVLFLSFFSHNMFEQGCFVFPWLALCLTSRTKTDRIRSARMTIARSRDKAHQPVSA